MHPFGCSAEETTIAVPFVRVILMPSDFAVPDLQIEVVGYLDITGPYPRLYLSKDLADAGGVLSSLAIIGTRNRDIKNSSCASSYVRLRGTVREFAEGEFLIDDVVRIEFAQRDVFELCYTQNQ